MQCEHMYFVTCGCENHTFRHKNGNLRLWQASVGRGKTEISVFGRQSVKLHGALHRSTLKRVKMHVATMGCEGPL